MNPDTSHPVQYSVDYPDRPLNRVTTFFRLLTLIPIAIVLVLLIPWRTKPARSSTGDEPLRPLPPPARGE